VLHRLQLRRELLHQRHERQIEEQGRVLGVVGDVDDLVREQARVDRVDHRADAGDGVVQLVVPVAVPGERADALGRLHAERAQHLRQAARAGVGLAVAVAVDAAFGGLGHDLRVAVVAVREADQVRDQQRRVHHQAMHVLPSSVQASPAGTGQV